MLQMDQIDVIKELQREGFGPTDIASRLGFDRKTVSKYMDREDFSPNQDHAERTVRSSTAGSRRSTSGLKKTGQCAISSGIRRSESTIAYAQSMRATTTAPTRSSNGISNP